MEKLEVGIVRVRPEEDADLPWPRYMTAGSAGLDLMAAVKAPTVIQPGEIRLIPTGIAIAVPRGFEAQIRPRSGLALKSGITVLNTPGTIDADYRGEIRVILYNASRVAFEVRRGDRIAQMVLAPVVRAVWEEARELEETARQEGGFGSTGLG